jgi:hypothetical protein
MKSTGHRNTKTGPEEVKKRTYGNGESARGVEAGDGESVEENGARTFFRAQMESTE